MEFDRDKVDEMTLALLWLTHFKEGDSVRAWKGHDFGTMDRLHERDYISDPKGKTKSVVLTEEGEKRSRELFGKYFAPRA
jgi:Domain of unknown function (DUF6429)